MQTIKIIKRGLPIRIEPAAPVFDIVSRVATFERKINVVTGRGRRHRVDTETEELFKLCRDPATKQDYILTYDGILPRIAKAIKAEGFEIDAVELPVTIPKFEACYDHLDEITMRDAQMRMLRVVLEYERAQLDAATGTGKTFFVKVMCQCYPQADCRIVIAAPNLNLMYDYLDVLKPMFKRGEVGQCGDGVKQLKARIIVSTFDSLENIEPQDKAIVFVDEVDTCGTRLRLQLLSRFTQSRMYGLSGSTETRADGADLGIEALFGPVLARATYTEGVEAGYLADVETYFYMQNNEPCLLENDTARKRQMYWNNASRNETIAGICKYWDAELRKRNGTEPQILVLVDTAEHMFRLQRLLPDYTPIYSSISDSVMKRLHRDGILPRNFTILHPKEKRALMQQAKEGTLRKMIGISTSMGTGTDLVGLDVLVRGDGGQTERTNIQYRGRATRGSFGVYCDIADTGANETMRRKARKRFKSARDAGWKPRVIDLWNEHTEVIGNERRKRK